jgi:hypothetical protein
VGEASKVLGTTASAVGLSAAALAFGACCVSPLAVTLLGVGGAVMLARLAVLQPYLVAATLALSGLGFRYAYRRRSGAEGENCPVRSRRGVHWAVWIGALIVICLDVASYLPRLFTRDDGAAAAAARIPYAVLGANDQPLRADFNRDRGDVRLLFLVDPVCPVCLRGLADMGDDLLAQLPANARLKVYVVFEPVIGGKAKDIPAAAALLKSSTPRAYWNATGDFGRQMSHALGYWNGNRWVYAWDTWLIYGLDATWNGADPPKPAFLMDQLGGLPHDSRFPFLDARVFSAKVHAMLAGLDQSRTSR